MEKNDTQAKIARDHENNRDYAKKEIETLRGYLTMLKNRKERMDHQKNQIRTIKTFFILPEIREAEEQLKRWKETLEKNSVGGGIDREGLNSTGGSPF